MRNRDVSDQRIVEDNRWRLIEQETDVSPPIELAMDLTLIIEKLDDHAERLLDQPNEQNLELAQSELKKMEIITVNNSEKTIWLNAAPKLKKYILKYTFLSRVAYLLQTKGIWKKKYLHKDSVDIEAYVELPLKVTTSAEPPTDKYEDWLFAIVTIRKVFKHMLDESTDISGVFQKSDRIIVTNRLHAWLEDVDRLDVKDRIQYTNLYDVANDIIFIPQ